MTHRMGDSTFAVCGYMYVAQCVVTAVGYFRRKEKTLEFSVLVYR